MKGTIKIGSVFLLLLVLGIVIITTSQSAVAPFPFYNPNDYFIKLISSTGGLTEDTAIFQFQNPYFLGDIKLDINSFIFEFNKYSGDDIKNYDVFILVDEQKQEPYSTFINKSCDFIDGNTSKLLSYDCSYYETNYKNIIVQEWKNLKNYDYILKPWEIINIKLRGRHKAGVGKQSVDWIPTFKAGLNSFEKSDWAWFNSSWAAKKQILIQELTGNNWINYSVYLNVTYDSDMQADFDDLRFTNSLETNELDYYIETKTNSNAAQVWVKTNLSANINTTVYMYYGNSAANTTSNRNTSFLWDDDGASNRLSEYTLVTTTATSFTYASGEYTIDSSGDLAAMAYPTSMGSSFGNYTTVVELKDTNVGYQCGMSIRTESTNNAYKVQKVNFNINAREIDVDLATIGGSGAGVYFNATLWAFGTTINWTSQGNTSSGSYQATDTTYPNGTSGFWTYGDNGGNGCLYKRIRIRAFGNPEPTYTICTEQNKNIINVTLLSPQNNTNIATGNINYQFNATSENAYHKNASLKIYYSNTTLYSITLNTSAIILNNINTITSSILLNGTFNWLIEVPDNDTGEVHLSATNTLNVHISTLNITYPLNGTTFFTDNITLNFTTASNRFTQFPCWQQYDSQTPVALNSGNNVTNGTIITSSFISANGNHTISAICNIDASGNITDIRSFRSISGGINITGANATTGLIIGNWTVRLANLTSNFEYNQIGTDNSSILLDYTQIPHGLTNITFIKSPYANMTFVSINLVNNSILNLTAYFLLIEDLINISIPINNSIFAQGNFNFILNTSSLPYINVGLNISYNLNSGNNIVLCNNCTTGSIGLTGIGGVNNITVKAISKIYSNGLDSFDNDRSEEHTS